MWSMICALHNIQEITTIFHKKVKASKLDHQEWVIINMYSSMITLLIFKKILPYKLQLKRYIRKKTKLIEIAWFVSKVLAEKRVIWKIIINQREAIQLEGSKQNQVFLAQSINIGELLLSNQKAVSRTVPADHRNIKMKEIWMRVFRTQWSSISQAKQFQ